MCERERARLAFAHYSSRQFRFTHTRERVQKIYRRFVDTKLTTAAQNHNVHDQLDFSGCRCVFIELAVAASLFARSEILFSYLFRIYHLFSLNDCISTGHIYINTYKHTHTLGRDLYYIINVSGARNAKIVCERCLYTMSTWIGQHFSNIILIHWQSTIVYNNKNITHTHTHTGKITQKCCYNGNRRIDFANGQPVSRKKQHQQQQQQLHKRHKTQQCRSGDATWQVPTSMFTCIHIHGLCIVVGVVVVVVVVVVFAERN